MGDRGAVATARTVGERRAEAIRRGDLNDILRLPELELPDRGAAVRETGAALQRLSDRELAVLVEAIRDLPRRVAGLEPIKVSRDAPIPDRVVEAMPFLERERRTSPLVLTIAVVSVVGILVAGLVMTMRRTMVRPVTAEEGQAGMSGAPSSGEPNMAHAAPDLAPDGGTTSMSGSAAAIAPDPSTTGQGTGSGEAGGEGV